MLCGECHEFYVHFYKYLCFMNDATAFVRFVFRMRVKRACLPDACVRMRGSMSSANQHGVQLARMLKPV